MEKKLLVNELEILASKNYKQYKILEFLAENMAFSSAL